MLINKTALRLFAIGIALVANGMIYFIAPDFLYNSIEFKQILIALLSVLIALMAVNVWVKLKEKEDTGFLEKVQICLTRLKSRK